MSSLKPSNSNILEFIEPSDHEVQPNSTPVEGGDEFNISFERGEKTESKI